jgi:hypothetical protein
MYDKYSLWIIAISRRELGSFRNAFENVKSRDSNRLLMPDSIPSNHTYFYDVILNNEELLMPCLAVSKLSYIRLETGSMQISEKKAVNCIISVRNRAGKNAQSPRCALYYSLKDFIGVFKFILSISREKKVGHITEQRIQIPLHPKR